MGRSWTRLQLGWSQARRSRFVFRRMQSIVILRFPLHRILDFATEPAKLRVKHKQLVVEQESSSTTVPLNEAAVVVVSQGQVTFSNSVISGLLEAGGMLVICNRNFLPVGMLLPLAANHVQVERFTNQRKASLPTNKRTWQQLIRSKISHQAGALEFVRRNSFGLDKLVPLVKSGDPSNVEARAARRYWGRLFDDDSFRRNRDLPGLNAILNYGYAVLRAIVARSICASGLHPGIGIHHHNRYSMFPLADDIMEPFRPVIDIEVATGMTHFAEYGGLTPDIKRAILTSLLGRFECEGEKRTLFDIANRVCSSLVDVYAGKRKQILLPTLISKAKVNRGSIGV